MDTSGSNTRSVVVGLLLAAIVAGSLVAFSLVAGSADDPTARRVLAAQPDLDVAPVVVEAPTVLGTRVRPQQTAASIVVTPPLADAPVDTAVLGIQLRNRGTDEGDGRGNDKNKGKDKTDPGTPAGSDTTEGPPTTHAPTCTCPEAEDNAKNKNNSPNGHAYGRYKQPGSSGLARGHDKSNGNANGHDKGPKKSK